jgi:hypothetical protein
VTLRGFMICLGGRSSGFCRSLCRACTSQISASTLILAQAVFSREPMSRHHHSKPLLKVTMTTVIGHEKNLHWMHESGTSG